MAQRTDLIEMRKKRGLNIYEMADICGVSVTVLAYVEDGEVTHPKIVKKIQRGYGLTDDQAELLLPINRRPHGGQYDPDKFVVPDPIDPDTIERRIADRKRTIAENAKAKIDSLKDIHYGRWKAMKHDA